MALGEPSGEEAHLSAVVELMLDITESSVAFCWELGAGKPSYPLRPSPRTLTVLPDIQCLCH